MKKNKTNSPQQYNFHSKNGSSDTKAIRSKINLLFSYSKVIAIIKTESEQPVFWRNVKFYLLKTLKASKVRLMKSERVFNDKVFKTSPRVKTPSFLVFKSLEKAFSRRKTEHRIFYMCLSPQPFHRQNSPSGSYITLQAERNYSLTKAAFFQTSPLSRKCTANISLII